jgi:hypothetical protein
MRLIGHVGDSQVAAGQLGWMEQVASSFGHMSTVCRGRMESGCMTEPEATISKPRPEQPVSVGPSQYDPRWMRYKATTLD